MNQDAANLIRTMERQIIEGELSPGKALIAMMDWTYADALNQCEKVAKMELDNMFRSVVSTAAHYIEARAK